jgi:hypothetical protein
MQDRGYGLPRIPHSGSSENTPSRKSILITSVYTRTHKRSAPAQPCVVYRKRSFLEQQLNTGYSPKYLEVGNSRQFAKEVRQPQRPGECRAVQGEPEVFPKLYRPTTLSGFSGTSSQPRR